MLHESALRPVAPRRLPGTAGGRRRGPAEGCIRSQRVLSSRRRSAPASHGGMTSGVFRAAERLRRQHGSGRALARTGLCARSLPVVVVAFTLKAAFYRTSFLACKRRHPRPGIRPLRSSARRSWGLSVAAATDVRLALELAGDPIGPRAPSGGRPPGWAARWPGVVHRPGPHQVPAHCEGQPAYSPNTFCPERIALWQSIHGFGWGL